MLLELVSNVVGVPGMVQRCMKKHEVLKILVEVLKHTESQMVFMS